MKILVSLLKGGFLYNFSPFRKNYNTRTKNFKTKYLKKIKALNIIKEIKDKTSRECYWISNNLLFIYNKVLKEPHFISSVPDTSTLGGQNL